MEESLQDEILVGETSRVKQLRCGFLVVPITVETCFVAAVKVKTRTGLLFTSGDA